MLKSVTKEIGGLRVTSTQFPAMKAYKLFGRLGRAIAPVASAVTGAMDGDANVGSVIAGIGSVLAELDDDTLESLALAILAGTTVVVTRAEGGQPMVVSLVGKTEIDAAFEGSLMAMFGAMKLAIEVNFSDFIASALSAARAKKAQADAKAAALKEAQALATQAAASTSA